MRFRTLVGVFLVLLPVLASAQDEIDGGRVKQLIRAIAANNPAVLEKEIQFPIVRKYPLPAITNAAEFRAQYAELFDDKLVERVKRSTLAKDWALVGWRGLSFSSGTIWFSQSADYKITAINYETVLGTRHREQLIEQQRASLPAELRTFDNPEFELISTTHRFRVDKIGDTYRLVRFLGTSTTSYDLVAVNGAIDFDGTLGDSHIDWKVGGKTYRISISLDGATATKTLTVYDTKTLEANPFAKPELVEDEAVRS